MGDKRISTRTLAEGSKVLHHPPDAEHPEGKLTMMGERSALRERLEAALPDNQARHDDLAAAHQERIDVKREAGQARGLPPEKSPL